MNTIELLAQSMPWMEISIISLIGLAYGLGYRRGQRREQNELRNIYLRLSRVSWDLQMQANQLTKVTDPRITDRPAFLRRIK